MALEAQVLPRPHLFEGARGNRDEARRVAYWCDTSKLARLPREEES